MNAFEGKWKFPRREEKINGTPETPTPPSEVQQDHPDFTDTVSQEHDGASMSNNVPSDVVKDAFPDTESMEILEAPLRDYSLIVFVSASGNTYTLTRDSEGGFAVHEKREGTTSRILPEMAGEYVVKKGEEFKYKAVNKKGDILDLKSRTVSRIEEVEA